MTHIQSNKDTYKSEHLVYHFLKKIQDELRLTYEKMTQKYGCQEQEGAETGLAQ